MTKILAINSGSTSVKYKLYNEKEKELKGKCFNEVKDHEKIIKTILREIGDLRDLVAVGHRVVYGGDKFVEPILINGTVLEDLEKYNELAPLHNPYNLLGIKAIKEFLPHIKQVAVFDTAFYSTLPEIARTYALPQEIREKYHIKKYGFHGISHQFVAQEATKKLNKKIEQLNLITCHLGGGWSVTAIKKGQPINTSMGYTPLEGLVMMTRSGDLDPGVVIELIKKTGSPLKHDSVQHVYNILNHESGIKGLSGGIEDYLDLLKAIIVGNEKAKLAFNVAIAKLVKYIASYWVELGGKVDAIVFSGAIGAGDSLTRNTVMKKIKCLGKVKMLAIKTNEELAIIRETRKILEEN
jgi:acetate kinase